MIISHAYYIISAIGYFLLIVITPMDIMQDGDVQKIVQFISDYIPRVQQANELRGLRAANDRIALYYAVGFVWSIITAPIVAVFSVIFERLCDPADYDWTDSSKAIVTNLVLSPGISIIIIWFVIYFTPNFRPNFAEISFGLLYELPPFSFIFILGVQSSLLIIVATLIWLPKTIITLFRGV